MATNATLEKGVGSFIPTPLYYSLQVRKKLASGEYRTEEVNCLCGNEGGFPICERDRYGIEYTLVLCEKCGLLRANPRMTAEAYAKFYENEYRHIYCAASVNHNQTWKVEDMEKEHQQTLIGNKAVTGALTLKEWLDHFDIKHKVIFDIGCNTGGMIKHLADLSGAEVYGCDYDITSINFGRGQGLPIFYGGSKELLKIGKKADLIILNHVIEHFTDIEGELENIRKLLKPNGHLYIGTLGFFAHPTKRILQNAHTYQFTLNSLNYVMNKNGWVLVHGTDKINAFYKYMGKGKVQAIPCKEEAGEIAKFLENPARIPALKVFNKFPVKERRKHLRKALQYGFPDLSELVYRCESMGIGAIIIAGGPSVSGYVEKIKELSGRNLIIAIEKMQNWCIDNGIRPDFVVALDASDDVAESLSTTYDDITYIVSSQCKPAVFNNLVGRTAYIAINPPDVNADKFDKELKKNGYTGHIAMLNTGGSVTLTSMSIAGLLGLRTLHIFGFDCHVTQGNYVKGITGTGLQDPQYIDIEIDGRVFKTTPAYLSFLQQFFVMYKTGIKEHPVWDKVLIYGDSMIKHAAKIDIDGDKT